MKSTNLENKETFSSKLATITSATVKNEGRALNIIFILCLICIIALSVFLYRSFTGFYVKLDETMQNNISLNIETLRNEHVDYIEELIANKFSEM